MLQTEKVRRICGGPNLFHSFVKSNGLFQFKEGFCRQEGATEFIGEFDKVYNRFFYTGFNKVIPQIQRLRGKTTKAKEQKIEAEQRRLKEEADRERAAAKEQK